MTDSGQGGSDEANSRSHSNSRLHRHGAGSSSVWGHPCGTESGQSERDRQPDAVLSKRRGCRRPGTRPRQLLARVSVQRALGDELWWQRGHALRRERAFHCGQDDKWCGPYDKWRLGGITVRRCLLPPTVEVGQRATTPAESAVRKVAIELPSTPSASRRGLPPSCVGSSRPVPGGAHARTHRIARVGQTLRRLHPTISRPTQRLHVRRFDKEAP